MSRFNLCYINKIYLLVSKFKLRKIIFLRNGNYSQINCFPTPSINFLAKNLESALNNAKVHDFLKISHYNSGNLAAISSGVISVSTTEWTVASVRLEYISARF